MTRSALVTGGAGFIGSHLVRRLLRDGWTVRVLDNLSSGSRAYLSELSGDLELQVGDVRDPDTCSTACAGIDTVFHLAAVVSVVQSIEDPVLSHDVTLGGTLKMLMAARATGVRRFVFSSSAAVYGSPEVMPVNERQPIDPQSPYGIDKATGEMYCRCFHELFGMETVALRYFNVFGPRQSAKSGYAAVIPLFVAAALAGNSPTIYGDGLQTRDFVYVANVVDANLLAASAPDAAGKTINVAGGESISLLDLVTVIERCTNRPLNPKFAPARAGEVRHSKADISQARLLLGYTPAVSVENGLQTTVEEELLQKNERGNE
jgi:nucleoside-diphosphate-sugar epimerase